MGIAKFYSDIIGSFVISKADGAYEDVIKEMGLDVYLDDITMNSFHDERRLASYVAGIT